MVRVHYFRTRIARALADALNTESGRAYTDALVRHWRVYRRHDHWLSRKAASKLQDAELGSATLLHSHSLDAAREGFYNACKTARTCRKQGLDNKYPFRCKRYRPTTWKNTAIRKDGEALLLSLARGNEPIRVRLPVGLCNLPPDAFREVKLVYDRSGYYEWHVAVEDGREPQDALGDRVVAVDSGEIHPLALTDGEETLIVTARELRAIGHWRNKKLAEIQHKQAAKVKGSRAWWRLQRAKNKLLAKTQRQQRDIEHKASRVAAEWVLERKAGIAAFGDVRDVGDGKRLSRESQQKVSQWTHGKVRAYFTYKVGEYGIQVEMQDEAYTTRTCPGCGHEHKPRVRVYTCPVCGLRAHRDAVGAANILSLYLQGEMGHIQPTAPKYRQPFRKACPERSRRERPRRSPEDTGQVAAAGRRLPYRKSVEAPHFQFSEGSVTYGVCTEPEDAAALAEAGFEFVELHVQRHLKPEEDEAAFLPQLARIQAAALPCVAANCFIPAHLKITGPQVDFDALARYVDVACGRAGRAGIETIVFGSGGARAIPDGFDRQQAWGQLIDFGRMLGPVAQRHGVTIAVEPLNQGETNVLNATADCARYVREVDHPGVRLLVDGYHWALERESAADIIAAGPLLCHAHTATYRTRLAPGLEPCDFEPFFQALKEGGYDGRISIEGKWDDLPGQAARALAELKRAAQAVGL